MSGVKRYDLDFPLIDPNGIAENQTTGGAADLVLNGAWCDLGTALQFDVGDVFPVGVGGISLEFDAAADISGVTFTITGKDENGITQTETVTGVTTTPVSTTKFWSQVTTIAANGAVASNVFIGNAATNTALVGTTVPLNTHAQTTATMAVQGLSGTCQFDLQQTFDAMRTVTNGSINWVNVTSNASADAIAAATIHATAVRVNLDSYADAAEFQFHVNSGVFR